MEQQLTTIRDQQRDTWNKFSSGWKKWDTFTMNFLKPMGDAIVESLEIQPTDTVLDVASGTGEPAMTIAKLAFNGKVQATDVAEQMLEVAKENAKRRELTNMDFKVADISELPFSDSTFDKISCRMGFMFFPDMLLAAKEMYRVCKNSGKLSTSVWSGPDENAWVTTMTSVLKKHIDMPAPPADAPGMFRCAQPGSLKKILEQAGFTNIQEKKVQSRVNFETPEQYWLNMTEIAAPVVAALGKTDDATRAKIKDELYETCKKFMKNNTLELNFGSIVLTAEK